jgi:hypothetical protein
MAILNGIIEQLKAERDRLDEAIRALEGVSNNRDQVGHRGPRKRRKMSAAARARISAAQKARWAKQKRSARID